MKKKRSLISHRVLFSLVVALSVGDSNANKVTQIIGERSSFQGANPTFDDDVEFLRKYTSVIVLSDKAGPARVALAPSWQGRVMTSSAENHSGRSLGWINRALIASG